jgi:hypothetical protein
MQATSATGGMTRSFDTMVARAMVSTMIMPVAAERPPMNANNAMTGKCSAIGTVNMKVSASTAFPEKWRSPPKAIGRTKMLMSSM